MQTMAALRQARIAGKRSAPAQDTEPQDWSDLWQQMLDVRAGAAGTRFPLTRLVHARQGGWTLQGTCSKASADLFALYKPMLDARHTLDHSTTAQPWLVAQLGQSLDGFVATSTGDSYYVTGPESLVHLHRLRALCDAVVVGAGTVAIDNPQLTTRRVAGVNAVRVVLDPAARLDGTAGVFSDGQAPTLWLCDQRVADMARERLACRRVGADLDGAHAAEVVAIPGLLDAAAHPAPDASGRAVAALAQRGLRLLFVEGGGMTVSRFYRENLLDRLHLVVAPVLIGEGRRGLQAAARPVMADCPRPPVRQYTLGEDLLWDMDLQG